MKTTDPLTVALVMATSGTGRGGMEKHTADLAEALANHGHRVHILAHPTYSDCFADSVQRHPLPFNLGRRNPWLKHRVRRMLNAIRPDIVHAQGNKAASLVSAARRKTYVTLGTLHGTKTSHESFDALDGVIGVSQDIIEALAHPHKRLIHNGVKNPADADTGIAAGPDNPIPRERPLLIAAGRLEPVKQFDRLIRAWARIDQVGKLVILGEGSQRVRLETLVKELGAQSRIELPGHESRLWHWLNAADACLISSSREGFPYIMVEALMARCPVLSTPVSGVRDFLPATGIASSDRIEDLVSLINASLSRTDSLRDRYEGSFQRAHAQLGFETMVSLTETFYRDLLASRNLARPIADGKHD